MKEIILSSGIGFGIGAFFTLCRIDRKSVV